jgi:transposase
MAYLVPDQLWTLVAPLLPAEPARPKGGRPRVPDRVALAGILFVLRTGIQWHALPGELGCSGKTCWRRLRDWHEAGVWVALHRVLLERLHGAGQLDWSRAALDSASFAAKKGARRPARTRPTAVTRAPSGTSSWTGAARRSASP